MNRKGSLLDIILLCIVLLVGSFSFFAFHKAFTEINTEFQSSDLIDNSSKEIINTTNTMLTSGHLLDHAAFIVFVMIVIGILLLAYMTDFSPAFVVLFIIMLLIGIIIAIQFSNAYYEVKTSSVFSTVATNFPMQNYIMENLPIVIVIIGILFGLIMYSKWRKGGDL